MKLIAQGKTNWKYVLIVVTLAFFVGGGILSYKYYIEKQLIFSQTEGKLREGIQKTSGVEEIDISNWKTFRNKRYGYELKYPEEESVIRSGNYFLPENQSDDVGLYIRFKKDSLYSHLSVNIFIAENEEKESISQWLKRKDFSDELTEDRISWLSDGFVYIKKWEKDKTSFKKIYFAKGEDYIYVISMSSDARGEESLSKISDKILSTVKVDAMPSDSEIAHFEDGIGWYNYQKKIGETISTGLGFLGTTYIGLFRLGIIENGKYQGDDLLLITALPEYTGKGPGSGKPRIYRFIVHNNTAVFLPKISALGEEYINESAGEAFAQMGLSYEVDSEFTIPRLEYSLTIKEIGSRQIVNYHTEEFGVLNKQKLVKAFYNEQYGDVYTTNVAFSPDKSFYFPLDREGSGELDSSEGCRGASCFQTNGFFVFRPDGTFLRYYYQPDFSPKDIVWDSEMSTTQTYSYRTRTGCGNEFVDYESIVSPQFLNEKDFVVAGYNKLGDSIYVLKDTDHPLLIEFYENYEKTFTYLYYEMGWSGYKLPLSRQEFLDSQPLFLWHDPFGRLIRFQNINFLPPFACEPVIYLYPTTTQEISISVKPRGEMTNSVPTYKTGWNVIVDPNGKIHDIALQKTYPYLFWEGWSLIFPLPKDGFVVAEPDIHDFFLDTLPKLGLNDKETYDFINIWEPKFKSSLYYFITFHDQDFIDYFAPIEVFPQPDTIIRILMDYKPLDEPISVRPIDIRTPQRQGFTVVEWGGLVR